MVDPSSVPEIPAIVQTGISIAVAIGGAVAIGFAYIRKFWPPAQPQSDDILIQGASIADMRPVRQIAQAADRLAAATEDLVKIVPILTDIRDFMKREATMDELARDAEAALERAARQRRDYDDERDRDRERRGR